MRKTLLIFLLAAYKLSFCSPETHFREKRGDDQNDDLLISEVLFNPKTGGVDFVEIYNPTAHSLSIGGVAIGNIDTAGAVANLKNLGSGVIASGEYRVISKSSDLVKAVYYCPYADRFIQLTALPAYNNTNGHVILLRDKEVIDRLDYTEKMHIPILKIVKGVSLERVSFDIVANTAGNFISAAASVGFATPGYANSVQEIAGLKQNVLTLESKVFSPDGDGFEDRMNISWRLKHYGNVATVTIYSDQGQLVRRLIKNESVATEGTMSWDGINERGGMAVYGLYIVVFDSFDISGNSVKLKKAFALVGKF